MESDTVRVAVADLEHAAEVLDPLPQAAQSKVPRSRPFLRQTNTIVRERHQNPFGVRLDIDIHVGRLGMT